MALVLHLPLEENILDATGNYTISGSVNSFVTYKGFKCARFSGNAITTPRFLYPIRNHVSWGFMVCSLNVNGGNYTSMIVDTAHYSSNGWGIQNYQSRYLGYQDTSFWLDNWHSIIVVCNADTNNYSLYVDQVKIQNTTYAVNNMFRNNDTDYFCIGKAARYGRNFNGYQRQWHVYDHSLSEKEVIELDDEIWGRKKTLGLVDDLNPNHYLKTDRGGDSCLFHRLIIFLILYVLIIYITLFINYKKGVL